MKKYQSHYCMLKDRYELNYMCITYQVMYVFAFLCNTKHSDINPDIHSVLMFSSS